MNKIVNQLVDSIGTPFIGSIAEKMCLENGTIIEINEGASKRWVSVEGLGLDFVIVKNDSLFSGQEFLSAVHFIQSEHGDSMFEQKLPLKLWFGMSAAQASVELGRGIKTKRVRGALGVHWNFLIVDSCLRWTLTFRKKAKNMYMLTAETRLLESRYY